MNDKKLIEFNNYLDFYECLLTQRQKEIMDYYYRDDYSLSEISELLGISRSGVQNSIKKVEDRLKEFESKLKLIDKFNRRNRIYEEMSLNPDFTEFVKRLKESE